MRRPASVWFNDTATTEIYTLSLHDALPILPHALRALRGGSGARRPEGHGRVSEGEGRGSRLRRRLTRRGRSEEHTSELQSRQYLVCRLLLEKHERPSSTCSGALPTFYAYIH